MAGDKYLCRLAGLCQYGTSAWPPYEPENDYGAPCPHVTPHVAYGCHEQDEPCTWTVAMGINKGCMCMPEDKARNVRIIN
jgi:hypothetical protein